MGENTKTKDFRERFEFRFMLGDHVICGRYFKIMDFNPVSLASFDLKDTISECAELINNDLKMKTQTYLELVAPRVFKDEAEMFHYFEDESHVEQMKWPGEGIVLRDESAPNYVWDAKTKAPVPAPTQFSDGEFTKNIGKEDILTYKLVFLDNGREVMSTIWDGIYVGTVRKKIELSNKGPKIDEPGGIYTLGFENYIRAKLTEGKSDLVFKIIQKICKVCTHETEWYSTADGYKKNVEISSFEDTEKGPKPVYNVVDGEEKEYTNTVFDWYYGDEDSENDTNEIRRKPKSRNRDFKKNKNE